MTPEHLANALAGRLESIQIPEPLSDAPVDPAFAAVATMRIQASILGKLAEFLADHAELLPPKEAILAALSTAIDTAFAALGRPFIAGLIKPLVKQSILNAASAMYDSLLNRTEV